MVGIKRSIIIQQSKNIKGITMIEVCAAIIIHEGRVLIAQRPAGDSLENLWEFPGGKIEPGETPEQSLRREILEELGIEIIVGDFFSENIHKYPDKEIRLRSYLCSVVDGQPRNEFHQKIVCVPVSGLAGYLFAPADVPFIRKLEQFSLE